jgi:glutamate--cysteine ligase
LSKFTDSLARFQLPEFRPAWGRFVRGIEKESLRVTPDARLAQTDHPQALGSTLTHPYITTDYSEALLELITPTCIEISECLDFLTDLHKFSYQHLPAGETLWASSMPCILESDDQIPLARYGSSNIGRLKTLYREGLGHRYGRLMQTIAGIHYNFSMPETFWTDYRAVRQSTLPMQEFQTQQYLHLIRNYHRYSWLLVYLFGASPTVCRCFTKGREHDLELLDPGTLYKPYATCLRMSNLGYKSEAQKSLFVCYNELDNYISSLQGAMSTPYPEYEKTGLKDGNRYLQINTNLLQLENEFYATIRPKRVGASGERPLELLRRDGIQYVEVRLLDLNPYLPLGIDEEEIRFLDTFLLFCLLSDSPACTEREYFETESNLAAIVNQGRMPGLILKHQGNDIPMQGWAESLMKDLRHSAALLDEVHATDGYSQSVAVQSAKVQDPDLTPSARILKEMKDGRLSFHAFGLKHSLAHQEWFRNQPISRHQLDHLVAVSAQSLAKQASIEASDDMSFDEYLAKWNSFR